MGEPSPWIANRQLGEDHMRTFAASTLTTFVLAVAVFCVGRGPNSDGSKLTELERLQTLLPMFPSLVEIDRHTMSKATLANITKCYRSDAVYEEVKRFYVDELNKAGWKCNGERSVKDWDKDLGGRELIFVNEAFGIGYYIAIYYVGEKANDPCTYGITVGWRA